MKEDPGAKVDELDGESPGVDQDVLVLDVPVDGAQLLALQDGLHHLQSANFSTKSQHLGILEAV